MFANYHDYKTKTQRSFYPESAKYNPTWIEMLYVQIFSWHFLFKIYLEKSIPKLYKKKLDCPHTTCSLKLADINFFQRDRRFYKTYTSSIDDEYHFILVCPICKELMSNFPSKNIIEVNFSCLKLITFLSVKNVKELCNLGKYIF